MTFKQPEDAVDDPFQHTQWIHNHEKHISHDYLPLGIVWPLINDLSCFLGARRENGLQAA